MPKQADVDVYCMTAKQLQRELVKIRKAIRKHRKAKGNSRCWHNDLKLYEVLPDSKAAGKMTQPEEELLRNCKRYIRRQQCQKNGCRK